MTEMESYRRNSIDYAKAIGIIVVVIGHCANNTFNVMTPYMYHMPLFFIIGGMVFNENKSFSSFIKVIIKKYFAYIILADAFLFLISYLLQKYTIITNLYKKQDSIYDYAVYFINTNMHVSFLFLVSWFLFAYALASVILYIYLHAINNFEPRYKLVTSILFITLSGYLSINVISVEYRNSWVIWLNYASQVLTAFSFMLIGKTFKDIIFKIPSITGVCISFLIVLTMKRMGFGGEIGISGSFYKHGFILTYIQVLLCSYIVLSISCFLSKAHYSKLFIYIGRQSKSIMTYHLLAFVVVDIFFGYIGMYDIRKTKALTHYSEPTFWPMYIIAGIFIPLAINFIICKLTNLFYYYNRTSQ